MSDDLLKRLRGIAKQGRIGGGVGVDALAYITADDADAAANRIEELTAECRDLTIRAEAAEEAHSEALAERDTLAEIVAIISPRVERDDLGCVGIVAGRNFYANSRWTETDGERFRAVLDRIEGGETDG